MPDPRAGNRLLKNIVVGRVVDVETCGTGAAPLLFWRGGYTSLGET